MYLTSYFDHTKFITYFRFAQEINHFDMDDFIKISPTWTKI